VALASTELAHAHHQGGELGDHSSRKHTTASAAAMSCTVPKATSAGPTSDAAISAPD